MTEVTLKGNPCHTNGEPPAVGSQAPAFSLVGVGLNEVSAADFAGKRVVLNIFPSIDTPTCQASVRQFNQRAGALENTAVVCVSADLPFAHKRFCGAEGLDAVSTGSTFRSEFLSDYGLKLTDGPLAGLGARAVVVLDPAGKVLHSQVVGEIADEPNYEAAIQALG